MKGLFPRNLRYMRDFAFAYPAFLQQSAAKSEQSENKENTILQQAAAKLPWGHHQLLLTKLKTNDEQRSRIPNCQKRLSHLGKMFFLVIT